MSSKRVRFITLIGVLFVVVAIGVSLLVAGISLDTRPFDLPDTQAGASDVSGQASSAEDGFVCVEVTTDTVQDVISTLQRPVSYSRRIEAVNYYSDGSASYTIDVSVLENAKSLKVTGAYETKNIIIADGMLYVWEDGDEDYYQAAMDTEEDETKLSDMYQMIMTYEDVLDIKPEYISFADYTDYYGEMCVIVRYTTQRLHYLTTCYISVNSGLLVGAKQYDGNTLVYTMTAADFSTEFPDAALFELPDGTNPVADIS